jgi:hypothetical protein
MHETKFLFSITTEFSGKMHRNSNNGSYFACMVSSDLPYAITYRAQSELQTQLPLSSPTTDWELGMKPMARFNLF